MIDFSSWMDLPTVWGFIIGIAILLYVLLDGFDLGVGILFPFAPSGECRSRMMNSIAPFWDGNETWLVLGGGGLFVAFPLAYSVLLPAFYIPIIAMLIGLIFRGVAFEFRFKSSEQTRPLWDLSFHMGSLLAAFMQGVLLGAWLQGVEMDGRQFAGGPMDWATGFSMFTGIAVVFGYVLQGSGWLIMKTDGITEQWARQAYRYSLLFVIAFMGLVSVITPFIHASIFEFWFTLPNFLLLSPIPIVTAALCLWAWKTSANSGNNDKPYTPFLCSVGLFVLGFLGIGISVYPWIIPYTATFTDAAAHSTALSITLIGVVIQLPIILGYTAYSYYVFRGKAGHEAMY